jgi:hypothetical protein
MMDMIKWYTPETKPIDGAYGLEVWGSLAEICSQVINTDRYDLSTPVGAKNMCGSASMFFLVALLYRAEAYASATHDAVPGERTGMYAAFDLLNGEQAEHCAVLTQDNIVIDLTLRQFFPEAPYPCVMRLEDYDAYVQARGASISADMTRFGRRYDVLRGMELSRKMDAILKIHTPYPEFMPIKGESYA